MEPSDALTEGSALLIVDVQRDFCPGGALPVPEGDAVVPVLNRWLETAARRAVPVFASRDWHPPGHPSFAARGGRWPPHCVQDTPGAGFHPDLHLPHGTELVSKGTRFDRDQYSAFDDTGLAERLRGDGIRELWVGGLAQDVCVRATVLDARREGFAVHLIPGASRPLDSQGGRRALRKMREAGADVPGDA